MLSEVQMVTAWPTVISSHRTIDKRLHGRTCGYEELSRMMPGHRRSMNARVPDSEAHLVKVDLRKLYLIRLAPLTATHPIRPCR